MTNKIIYLAPRAKKQRKRPVKLDQKPGPAALIANIIGQALNDYVCGDARQSDDARFYFMSDDYQQHISCLGLVDDMMPAALQERIVILDG